MTQAIAPKTALYDRDYLQWVKDIVNKLRAETLST